MATPPVPSPCLGLAYEEPADQAPMVTSGPIACRPLTTANLTNEQYDQIDWKAMRDKFIPRMNERIQQEKEAAQGLARNDFINYDITMSDRHPPAPSSALDPSAEKLKKDVMTGRFGRNRKMSKISHADAFANTAPIDEATLRKNIDERPRVEVIFKQAVPPGIREVANPVGSDLVDYYMKQIACNELVGGPIDPDNANKPVPDFCETYYRMKKEHEERQEMAWKEEKKQMKQPRGNMTQPKQSSFADVVQTIVQKKGLALNRDIRLANRPRGGSTSVVQVLHRSISTFAPGGEDHPDHKERKDSLAKLSAINSSSVNVGDTFNGLSGSLVINTTSARMSHASAGAEVADKRSSSASKKPTASSRHASLNSLECGPGVGNRGSTSSQALREPNPPDPLDWTRALGGPSKRSSREANKRVSAESDNQTSKNSGKNKFFRDLEPGDEQDFVRVFGLGAQLKAEPRQASPEYFSIPGTLRGDITPLPLEPHNPEDGNIGISKPLDGSLHKGSFARQVQQTLNPRAINDPDCGYRLLDNFLPHDHRVHIPEFLDTDVAHLTKTKLYRGATDIKEWEQKNKTQQDVHQAAGDCESGPVVQEERGTDAVAEDELIECRGLPPTGV